MKKGFLIFVLLVSYFNVTALAANFVICKSKYALCTTAQCTPVPRKKDLVSCNCDVKTGYSVGMKQCQKVEESSEGQLISSRYYPIHSYVVCSNHRPWAWCLDKPCVIDKNDPSKAKCFCSTVKNLGDYIIVTDTYNKSICNSGIISSATVKQSKQITDFLKSQKKLQPFPIKVIKSE